MGEIATVGLKSFKMNWTWILGLLLIHPVSVRGCLPTFGLRDVVRTINERGVVARRPKIDPALAVRIGDEAVALQLLRDRAIQEAARDIRAYMTSGRSFNREVADPDSKPNTTTTTPFPWADDFVPGDFLDFEGEGQAAEAIQVGDLLLDYLKRIEGNYTRLYLVLFLTVLALIFLAANSVLGPYILSSFISLGQETKAYASNSRDLPADDQDRMCEAVSLYFKYLRFRDRFCHLSGIKEFEKKHKKKGQDDSSESDSSDDEVLVSDKKTREEKVVPSKKQGKPGGKNTNPKVKKARHPKQAKGARQKEKPAKQSKPAKMNNRKDKKSQQKKPTKAQNIRDEKTEKSKSPKAKEAYLENKRRQTAKANLKPVTKTTKTAKKKNLKGRSQPTKEKKPTKKRKVLPDTKLTTINEVEEGGRTQRKKMPQNWPTLN